MIDVSETDLIRYLKILGITQREPAFDALKDIIRAQMLSIPFENISKLYYHKTTGLKGIPGFGQFLSGVEKYHFGGTCYSNNFYLHQLLKFLDYEVKLCGADMSKPDVHIANIVTFKDQEYIVDTGYGAPFLEPLPRNLQADYIIHSGTNKYVLKPQDVNGCSHLEMFKDGILQHGYLLKPQSRSIEDFTKVISESFNPDATFMNAILLTKFSPDYSIIIRNNNFTEIKNNSVHTEQIDTKDELISLINQKFVIPIGILTTVLSGITMSLDVWE